LSKLKPYYPVFKFVLIFGGIYVILSLAYYFYLQQEYSDIHYPDPITSQVSYQTELGLEALGYNALTVPSTVIPSMMLYIDQQVVYRIIEGCNAVSIMILFAAFVLAFAKAWKPTILFLLSGILFIYLVNVARLIILGIVYVDLPEYKEFAHDIAFPATIYGAVVLLWLLWLRKRPAKV
jgi:exosortase family protein XrtF